MALVAREGDPADQVGQETGPGADRQHQPDHPDQGYVRAPISCQAGADAQGSAGAQTDEEALAGNLLKAFSLSSRLVALTVHEPEFCLQVSEKPVASAWARLQSQHINQVTTLRHMRYALEPYERFVLERLDGRSDLESLVDALLAG